ncbi:transmembrane protein, putative (macronuclear) [Tetrahymena thermophila SB210]|uniref:Transmembrane protein, putative n=1 Tax=Tetrahymena thermophila (strain SB210) TaxID=312017 RepID=Q23KG2_TETTS|nr:transmembrane protein, putative [Tetrahymena thermophila SB210]EAR96881.2 transmembrane protein, putative [Tetrahymena thermophila SB210]|eukprot:XP_001017126.2 transmembrane protein, putative [Tetrahymena thermophila SB210]
MIENRYIIQEFKPEFEKKLQIFENSFVTNSLLFGLIKVNRSYDKVSYEQYFNQKYGEGFILLLLDRENNDNLVGKVLFGMKEVLVNNKTFKAAFIHEIRFGNVCNTNLAVQQKLIDYGLQKAAKQYQCQLAYLIFDQAKKGDFEDLFAKELNFQKVGEIVSQISMQNNMIKLQDEIGDNLKFKEFLPLEAQEFHKNQLNKKSEDFYCKELFSSEQTKTFVFANLDNTDVYGLSVYFDDKRFSKNFSRFIISSNLLQNKLFIKIFYLLVNVLFATLLFLQKSEEGLLNDDLKYQTIIYLGLNIGICLAFYQTQKAFQKFSGTVGRIFQPIEIEKLVQSQTKKREIYETLIRNIQGICFQNKTSQIRVDIDTRGDHLDYFNQKSCFTPYNENQFQFYAASLSGENINLVDIKLLSVDPRDF